MQVGRFKLGATWLPALLIGIVYWPKSQVVRSFGAELVIHIGPVAIYVEAT